METENNTNQTEQAVAQIEQKRAEVEHRIEMAQKIDKHQVDMQIAKEKAAAKPAESKE